MAHPAADVTDNQDRTAVLPRLKSTLLGGFTVMPRITRNTPPPPARSTAPARNQGEGNRTTAPATSTPTSQPPATSSRVQEMQQGAQLTRSRLENELPANVQRNANQNQRSTATQNGRVPTTQPGQRSTRDQRVQEALNEIIRAYRDSGWELPQNAAKELARQLQNGDPEFRRLLMQEFLTNPALTALDRVQILQAANGDTVPTPPAALAGTDILQPPLTEDERKVIAQSLGQLFDKKSVSEELQGALREIVEWDALVGASGLGHLSTDGGNHIAQLIAKSGSQNLKELYANQVLSILLQATDTVYPESIASKLFLVLEGCSEELQQRAFIDIVQSEKLLNKLSRSMDGAAVMEGLINLYRRNASAITYDLLHSVDGSGNTQTSGLMAMSRFFQHTLFNPSLSESIRNGLFDTLQSLAAQYRTVDGIYGGAPGRTPVGVTLLGRLMGTIANGFELMVREKKAREEATRQLIGLFVGLLPFSSLVGKPVEDAITEIAKVFGEKIAQDFAKRVSGKVVSDLQKEFTNFLTDRVTEGWGGIWAGVNAQNVNELFNMLSKLFETGSLPDPYDNPHTGGSGQPAEINENTQAILPAFNDARSVIQGQLVSI